MRVDSAGTSSSTSADDDVETVRRDGVAGSRDCGLNESCAPNEKTMILRSCPSKNDPSNQTQWALESFPNRNHVLMGSVKMRFIEKENGDET